jgi:hypothetical protein
MDGSAAPFVSRQSKRIPFLAVRNGMSTPPLFAHVYNATPHYFIKVKMATVGGFVGTQMAYASCMQRTFLLEPASLADHAGNLARNGG